MKQQMLKQLICKSSKSTISVVFATMAIGIGSYYQEIGQGGRDGKSAKAFLYYNGQDIAANNPGMTGEMMNFCLDEGECVRKRLMTYLRSYETKSRTDVHSCCSHCLRKCQCAACSE